MRLLDFIKFQVRHTNGKVSGNIVSNIFFAVIKVIEMISFKFGIDLTGLSNDLKDDKEVMNCLKEIEIESVASKLNLGPKTDLLLKLCTKAVGKFSENKLLNMTKSKNGDTSGIMNKLSAKPLNESLKVKYDDL